MNSNERAEHFARGVSVVFTGPGLSLPNVQQAIEEVGVFGEYDLARSGIQFTLAAELPENVDFDVAITQLAGVLGGRVSGVTFNTRPYGVIRVDKPPGRSAKAGMLDRLRRDSGSTIRTSHSPDQLGPPPASPPPMPTALSGAEGASFSPVLQQPEPDPEPEHPVDPRGEVSIRLAVSRLIRGIRFILLAALTGVAVVLEPFTQTEISEADSDSGGNNQRNNRKDLEHDITE